MVGKKRGQDQKENISSLTSGAQVHATLVSPSVYPKAGPLSRSLLPSLFQALVRSFPTGKKEVGKEPGLPSPISTAQPGLGGGGWRAVLANCSGPCSSSCWDSWGSSQLQ